LRDARNVNALLGEGLKTEDEVDGEREQCRKDSLNKQTPGD
jgi:hypothetical protein